MSEVILEENSACSSVDAKLTARIDNIPGNANAIFSLSYSTTCPTGMEADSPKLHIVANGIPYGPYTSVTLPALVTTPIGDINITGGFDNPVFSPVNYGSYSIELQLDAVDKCGNVEIVRRALFWDKVPPVPKALLGSDSSGGYVEGDSAKVGSGSDMSVMGFLKDYQGIALGPAADQKLRLRLFDTVTGLDCPGYLIFDYSADLEMGATLPIGGTGSPNFGTDIGPFFGGGTGVESFSGIAGDFGIEFDKVGWADFHGYTYSQAKNIGISLEVSVQVNGVDHWSNIALSNFPIYYLEQHYCAQRLTVSPADLANQKIPVSRTNVMSTHIDIDFVEVGPISWSIGNNNLEFAVGGSPVSQTSPDPSGVSIFRIEYEENAIEIYVSNFARDFLIPIECSTIFEHKHTGEKARVTTRIHLDYEQATTDTGDNQAFPVFLINSYDQENCLASIISLYQIALNYGGMGPVTTKAALEFAGQMAELPNPYNPSTFHTASYTHALFVQHEMKLTIALRALNGKDEIHSNIVFQIKAI